MVRHIWEIGRSGTGQFLPIVCDLVEPAAQTRSQRSREVPHHKPKSVSRSMEALKDALVGRASQDFDQASTERVS